MKRSGSKSIESKHSEEETMPLAKWCQVDENGLARWDNDKLTCCLKEEEQEDALFLRNVVHGTILTGDLYPLLFDDDAVDEQWCNGDSTAQLRSFSFLRQLSREEYLQLSQEHQLFVGVAVRDIFFAVSDRKMLLEVEKKRLLFLLESLLSVVDPPAILIPGAERGDVALPFTFYPSKRYTSLRYTECLDPELFADNPDKAILLPLFAKRRVGDQVFHAIFVNQQDASYHNFENIIPLDRALSSNSDPEWNFDIFDFEMGNIRLIGASTHENIDQSIFLLDLTGEDCQKLERLDGFGLYAKPQNASQRGGRRYIFQSTHLSAALTRAIRESGLLEKITLPYWNCSFVSVNSVFRVNRFEVDDDSFSCHRDTPYYDRSKLHISTHTLLIYLTGGEVPTDEDVAGCRVLEFLPWGPSLKSLDAFTCVVFHQSLPHQGRPFASGPKVFLRTELIFEAPHRTYLPDDIPGSIFARAVYFSIESCFNENLAASAHACYETVNSLHWGGDKVIEPTDPSTLLLKKWPMNRGERVAFVTSGYDYFFPKTVGLKLAAVIAVLDYFNCRVAISTSESEKGGNELENLQFAAFRSLCDSTVLSDKGTSGICDRAWQVLRDYSSGSSSMFEMLSSESKETKLLEIVTEDNLPDGEQHCCTAHAGSDFKPWNYHPFAADYKSRQREAMRRLLLAPVLFCGRKVVVDDELIVVDGDKVCFVDKDESSCPHINFAACMNDCGSEDWMRKAFISAPNLLLPPVPFVESDAGIRLAVDFFRNTWMLPNDAEELNRRIAVPRYIRDSRVGWNRFRNASTLDEALYENGELYEEGYNGYWSEGGDY